MNYTEEILPFITVRATLLNSDNTALIHENRAKSVSHMRILDWLVVEGSFIDKAVTFMV